MTHIGQEGGFCPACIFCQPTCFVQFPGPLLHSLLKHLIGIQKRRLDCFPFDDLVLKLPGSFRDKLLQLIPCSSAALSVLLLLPLYRLWHPDIRQSHLFR